MIAYKAVQVTPDGQPMSLMAGVLPPQLCTVYPTKAKQRYFKPLTKRGKVWIEQYSAGE